MPSLRSRSAAFLFLVVASPLAAQPGAFELLEEVRAAYRGLESYRDQGTIEILTRDAGGETRRSAELTTEASSSGAFLFRVADAGGGERVLWREDEAARLYDGGRGEVREVGSLAAELAHGFGDGALEALVVPLTLAGNAEALADPEAAAVEGPEPCGESSCWVLYLTRMSGTIEAWLLVDRGTRLVRRVEVVLHPAAAATDLDAGRATTIRVEHRMDPPGEDAVAIAFEPPPEPARPPAVGLGKTTAGSAPAEEGPEVGFFDEITVALFTFTARIVDSRGDPVLGLEPGDLRVTAGGRELPVTALDWVGPASAPRTALDVSESGAGERAPPAAPASADRLVVLFVQAEYEPTVARGHLRTLHSLQDLVRGLPPGDRVAVVSHYARFKLWHDFSRDREAIARILERAILPTAEPLARRSRRGPSLAVHLDPRAARRATRPERALELLGEALRPFPGEKVVVWVGWALGELGVGGVSMGARYGPALRALDAARATVFVLDVTEADWHALEAGLKTVAHDTGGTYAKTFHFTAQAVHKLARTLSGHYVVTIDRSGLGNARGPLRVALQSARGQVLHRPIVLR